MKNVMKNVMKKRVYLFTILLCLALVGCGGKEGSISFQPAEGDLAVFGELVDDLFALSPDKNKLVSREDAFEYLKSKGYSFYFPAKSALDDIEEPEDAYAVGTTLYLKPSYIIDYCTDVENSYISINAIDDRITSIQIEMEGCEEEIGNEVRKYFNEAIASGVFDSYETEVSMIGESEDWVKLTYEFYEQPLADNPSQEPYAMMVVFPESIQITFIIMD